MNRGSGGTAVKGRSAIAGLVLGLLLALLPLAPGRAGEVVEGYLHLSPTRVRVANQEYPLLNPVVDPSVRYRYPFVTRCRNLEGGIEAPCDLSTLLGVGFVEQGRLTLRDGSVEFIDILRMFP